MELHVDIRKDFGNFSMHVQFCAGEGITGLLGASGCGKSLTLKCIAGVEKPDSGVIRLNGRTLFDSEKRINLPPQQRRVGYLFQNYALFPNMTVAQNILCGLHRVKARDERDRQLERMCDLFQLRGLEKQKPHQLSGGQAQRVALARILATKPQLLLLDEPFSALDSHLREQLQPQTHILLKELGIQTLLVTHSRDEAYRMCGQLRVMEDGRVIRSGDTRAVFANPGTTAAARLTGCKNIIPARRVDQFHVEAPQWGVTLRTAAPVPEDVCAIGIRAHSFCLAGEENACNVVWKGQMEEPFEWTMLFRFAGQTDGEDVWWRLPKDRLPEALPERLSVAPEDVLLLTKGEV